MTAAHACSSGTPQLVLQWNEVPWCFLGDTATKANNWEGLAEALKQKLLKWKGLLALLSYRGRVLVINNLVASPLWHRIKAIPPP